MKKRMVGNYTDFMKDIDYSDISENALLAITHDEIAKFYKIQNNTHCHTINEADNGDIMAVIFYSIRRRYQLTKIATDTFYVRIYTVKTIDAESEINTFYGDYFLDN